MKLMNLGLATFLSFPLLLNQFAVKQKLYAYSGYPISSTNYMYIL